MICCATSVPDSTAKPLAPPFANEDIIPSSIALLPPSANNRSTFGPNKLPITPLPKTVNVAANSKPAAGAAAKRALPLSTSTSLPAAKSSSA